MTANHDPIPLTTAQAIEPVAWACGQCRTILSTLDAARDHCRCERCKGLITGRDYGHICSSCRPIVRDEERAEAKARSVIFDAEAFAKARKVPESAWSDTVVWEDGSGDMSGDGYFSSTDAVRERCARDGVPVPAYVWGTAPEMMSLDADSIIDAALDDSYDGARDAITAEAEKELQALLDAWCERHPVKWWSEDRSVAVMMTGRSEAVPK